MRCFLLLISACLVAQQQSDPVFGTTVVESSGFRGQIYHVHRWTKKLPDFSKMKPVGSIYTPVLNVPPQAFSRGFPGVTDQNEFFGIDYTARIWIENAGMYRFALKSDDGADLFIDGNLVIDNDGQHPPVENFGQANLTKGLHVIHVPYYQGPRWLVALVLKVEPPGETKFVIFNTADYKPAGDPAAQ